MAGSSRRAVLGGLCAAALWLGVAAAPAQAAIDPVFIYTAPANVPPGTGFNGPCGITVDSAANVYVSDYYHHVVDVFGSGSPLSYKTQAKEVDPLDGPCGLATDSTGKLYVNDYHRSVVRYAPATYPPVNNTLYTAGATINSGEPTGVAVNPATNAVFVDDRDRIAAYNASGTPLEEIGIGNLGDGYGLAFSQFAGTLGRLYVADASTNTVKAYEPLTSLTVPVATIAGPPGGFASLKDSALAVDRVTGDVYVADRRSSPFTERPESTIQIFDSAGAYKGHLKYNVIDAAPVGLAVDNSVGANQGRVYVTSGNTSGASVYAYTAGAATNATPLAPTASLGSSDPEAATRAVSADAAAGEGAVGSQSAVGASPAASGRAANLKRRAKHHRRAMHRRHHLQRRSR